MTRPAAILLSIAGSVFVGFLILEVGLRAVGYSAAPVVAPDSMRGWALIPNLPGITNSQGLRDRERTVLKPAGTVRIAVLGDSMAEGMQVALEQTFPSVLEELLGARACPGGAPVEVINFAVQGYGTAQQRLTLNQQVWAYDPDVVVLAMFPGNDVRDNVRALKGLDYLPFYTLVEGNLVLDLSFRQRWSYRVRTLGAGVIRYSRLAQWFNRTRFLLKAQLRAWSDRRQSEARGLGEAGVDNMVFLDPAPLEWEQAWRVTEAIVARMNKDTMAHGARFVVAIVGTAAEVNPDEGPRTALAAAIGASDLSPPRRRVTALGLKAGFPVLDLVEPLRRDAVRQNACLHGEIGAPPCTGHLTPAGHRAVADALAGHLCARP
jgi:lysophospholipase L1-like esterase